VQIRDSPRYCNAYALPFCHWFTPGRRQRRFTAKPGDLPANDAKILSVGEKYATQNWGRNTTFLLFVHRAKLSKASPFFAGKEAFSKIKTIRIFRQINK